MQNHNPCNDGRAAVPCRSGVELERTCPMPGRATSEALVALPLVAPEIVTAVTNLIFIQAIGQTISLCNVIMAQVVLCITVMMPAIRGRLCDMPRDHEDR